MDTTPKPRFMLDVRYLGSYISAMCKDGLVSIPGLLLEESRLALLSEMEAMELQQAETETGPYRVKQDYVYQTEFPEDSLFVQLAQEVSRNVNAAAYSMLSKTLNYNDMVVQRYEPTDMGISPHRDGLRYRDVIAIVILEGEGEFFRCDDRDGSNPVAIRNDPGDVLLMEAPGFFYRERQPFHYVGKIHSRRTSFALRQNRLLEK